MITSGRVWWLCRVACNFMVQGLGTRYLISRYHGMCCCWGWVRWWRGHEEIILLLLVHRSILHRPSFSCCCCWQSPLLCAPIMLFFLKLFNLGSEVSIWQQPGLFPYSQLKESIDHSKRRMCGLWTWFRRWLVWRHSKTFTSLMLESACIYLGATQSELSRFKFQPLSQCRGCYGLRPEE